MAPKKLTEADKTSILKLYHEPEETTSTLADRFGVSNSTISRLLKASLPQKEYRRLIQQKRSTADKGTTAAISTKTAKQEKPSPTKSKAKEEPTEAETTPQVDKPAPKLKPKKIEEAAEAPPTETPASEANEKPTPVKRSRRRSKSTTQADDSAAQLTLPTEEDQAEVPQSPSPGPPKLKTEPVPAEVEEEEVTETIPTDWDEDVSTLDDDYDEDDEDDEDDFEDEGEAWDGDETDGAPHLEKLEIAPLTEASLPRLCYVVVERSSSELVALPLRTFAHLGEIPETEGESRTLPVFDNHRVARRFSRRNQRVVKLPDGNLLYTTSPYLMAKGITRLLIDGQVFALEDNDDFEENGDFE
jgi:transposase-like protein